MLSVCPVVFGISSAFVRTGLWLIAHWVLAIGCLPYIGRVARFPWASVRTSTSSRGVRLA